MKSQLRKLIQNQAVIRGQEFKMSSGGISRLVIDCSRVLRTHEGFCALRKVMAERLAYTDFDAVGGPLSGSEPICAAVMAEFAEKRAIDWFGVRKERKNRGYDRGLITGPLKSKQKVILVEDVCTTGGNLLRAIQAIEIEDVKVQKIIVVVDRGGLSHVAEKTGLYCESIFVIDEIVDPKELDDAKVFVLS